MAGQSALLSGGASAGGNAMDSVLELLERWVETRSDKLLFEFRNVHGAARHTYRSLLTAVDSLAGGLHGLQLAPGARVLLAFPPGLDTIISLLAAARAGLIAVPVALPRTANDAAMRRLLAVQGDCAASALLCPDAQLARLSALCAAQPALSHLRLSATGALSASAPPPTVAQQEILFLQYTSGSTGTPRGVIVTHRNVIENARATVSCVPIGVSWLPQHHDMGLIGYHLFPIIAGGASYSMAPTDFLRRPASWLRLISEVGASHTSAPDFAYEYCLRPGKITAAELEGLDLSSLQVMMNGGEPVRPESMRRFQQRYAPYGLKPEACMVAYGLAEATLSVTQRGRGSLRLARAPLRAGLALPVTGDETGIEIASCGQPVPGVSVSIAGAGGLADVIGEVLVSGASVTPGYWNAPQQAGQLHSGDLGFLHGGELFICGRQKELLIVGGANFYPDDLEAAASSEHASLRARGICAFQDSGGRVVLLAEVEPAAVAPDPARLASAVRRTCGLLPDAVHVVGPHSICLTTSGKLARAETRQRWEAGALAVRASWTAGGQTVQPGLAEPLTWRTAVQAVFARQGVSAADAGVPLGALGIDSLALASMQLELEDVLRACGAGGVAEACDAPILQQVSLNMLVEVLAPMDQADARACAAALDGLLALKATFDSAIGMRMQADCQLAWPSNDARAPARTGRAILLTGATGFFGPFLLHELMHQTDAEIIVLVRAENADAGLRRVEAALARALLWTPALWLRVRAVCGDLGQTHFGLPDDAWAALVEQVGAIYHNGAMVNYVATYDAMRAANVEGTRTALALARASGAVLQHISSTFIFGWSARGILMEQDCNPGMQALDFGYAQTKWVAEQLCLSARAQGADVRIFRPSLISVSTAGAGDQDDVALRLLAFMIRHGVAVDTPNQLSIVAADVIAHNVVGISLQERAPAHALHVTADRYYSMTELTRVLEREHGLRFRYLDIPHFIDALNQRCTADDPVFPLLDFFNRSAGKIAAMQLKRYSSEVYQRERAHLADARPDPSLSQTGFYLLRYLRERGWIAQVRAVPVA
jgi:thioester reductase-like protein